MNIEVEYLDKHGSMSNQNHYISKLGLVKHMAIAGQRYAPTSKKYLKQLECSYNIVIFYNLML